MSKIRLLTDHLANQIAAGEVVERPASVVKELVENSLDAGSSRISIQIEGSGARLIRVVDNGEGMDGDDVLLSIERHATSKLNAESRLERIETLGFRGEALPSIGSVSRLILVSRPVDSDTGTRAEIRYGKLQGVHEAGCAQGTIVEVHNLFGNVPVRKKFLKTARTEQHHIEEVIRNQSLAHVNTAFKLEIDGRSSLDLPARDSLEERFHDVFRSREYWLRIDPEEQSAEGMDIRGYLLQPESTAARGNRLRILVNGRPVQDRMVRHGVIEGLHGFLMKGQAPAGVVLISLPADQVDVNVHPAKQEIRFRSAQEVHRCIVRAVSRSLRCYQDEVRSDIFGMPQPEDIPSGGEKQEQPVGAPVERSAPRLFNGKRSTLSEAEKDRGISRIAERVASYDHEPAEPAVQPSAGETLPAESDLAGLRLIGQFLGLYLVAEKEDRLVMIDQHAAHERLIYEELRRNYLDRAVPRQSLMFPVSVELSVDESETAKSHGDDIDRLGFQVEHFGDDTWVIKSVPALASQVDAAELLHDTLAQLRSGTTGPGSGRVAAGIDNLLASMACKAAVKAGNRLAPEEIVELLANMEKSANFSHCPHGRPVVKFFSKREIEQWFKRV